MFGRQIFGNPRLSATRALRQGSGSIANRLSSTAERHSMMREVRHEIVSLAGLVGGPVLNQAGEQVGVLVDLIARVPGDEPYPPVTGLVIRVGWRRAFLDAATIDRLGHGSVRLKTAKMDLRDYQRREGEVLLARDILDHQLVDTDEVQVIRAADLYLAQAGGQVRLVGVDVSLQTLLRRLGPKRWRWLPTPDRVIDWDAIESFGLDVGAAPAAVRLREPHSALRRMRPAELADVLEVLDRRGRQDLLHSLDDETAADALEEMEPEELTALLRELEPAQAAELLARMEPDEAVDALRDLPEEEQTALLGEMPADKQRELAGLLGFPEDVAGGFMTSVLACARPGQTVAEVRHMLAEQASHQTEIDAVAVVDDDGRLIADVSVFDLLVSDGDKTVGDWVDPEHPPAAVRRDDDLDTVATELVESRRSSLVVVDDEQRPVGRILSDDVLDALLPEHGRLHFPRLLQ